MFILNLFYSIKPYFIISKWFYSTTPNDTDTIIIFFNWITLKRIISVIKIISQTNYLSSHDYELCKSVHIFFHSPKLWGSYFVSWTYLDYTFDNGSNCTVFYTKKFNELVFICLKTFLLEHGLIDLKFYTRIDIPGNFKVFSICKIHYYKFLCPSLFYGERMNKFSNKNIHPDLILLISKFYLPQPKNSRKSRSRSIKLL